MINSTISKKFVTKNQKKWFGETKIHKKLKVSLNEHKGNRIISPCEIIETGCASWFLAGLIRITRSGKPIPLLYRLLCVRYRISTAILICDTFLVPNFLKVVPLWHLQKFPKWTLKNFNFSKNEANKKIQNSIFLLRLFFRFYKKWFHNFFQKFKNRHAEKFQILKSS